MNSDRLSRRDFGLQAALAMALSPSEGSAVEPQPQDQPPLDAAGQAEVAAKFADVVRQYGSRLSDEQKSRVRGVLAEHQRMLARVRAFTVENSDPPATGLRLYPSDTAAAALKKG
jgi:hypothetical protein